MNSDISYTTLHSKVFKSGPAIWAFRLFRWILGTLKGTYGVYNTHMRIPGLRAHIRGPWFQP